MNKNLVEPKILPGFLELSPTEQIKFKKLKTLIAKNFELYGYNPIDTVVIEREDVLLAKAGGETEKQIFKINKGDKDMALRFDLTVSFARYVASREGELTFPFKRFQVGKVYRGERPQKGRYREFYQCDIDVIGKNNLSVYYDAEVPSIMAKIFRQIGDFSVVIKINNRKILFGYLNSLNLNADINEVVRLIDKYDKIGRENFVASLEDLNITKENVKKIVEFIEKSGNNVEKIEYLKNLHIEDENFNLGISELETVLNGVKSFGEEDCFQVDFKISRGLDYYTGTVYETFIIGHEDFGSVCSGGRYDNLAGCYTESKLPGVGMSIGLSRLFVLLRDNNLLKFEDSSVCDALVLSLGDYISDAIKLSEKLRGQGIKTVVYFEEGKFKNKMAYADKLHVPYVLILGEDEIKENKITIRNMKESSQQTLSFEEIVKILK